MLAGLLFLSQVKAHVKFFFSDDVHDLLGRPIRNAPGAMSDGVMSTSGPCGGNLAWGANGFSYTEEDEAIIMKINYNGGHKSSENVFRPAWNCVDDEDADIPQNMLDDTDPTGTVQEPTCVWLECPERNPGGNANRCGASGGNDFTRGYIASCTVPANSAGKKCTMSLLDQRNPSWGGCYDLQVASVQATAPPQAIGGGATPSPVGSVDDSIVGTYYTSDESKSTTIANTPDGVSCCTLNYGSFFVFEMDGHMEVISEVNAECSGELFVHNSVQELTKDVMGPVWRAEVVMGVPGNLQNYELSISNEILQLQQLDPEQPQFCDFAVTRTLDDSAGGRTGLSLAATALSLLSLAILL